MNAALAEAFVESVGDARRLEDIVPVHSICRRVASDGEIWNQGKQALHDLPALFKAAELAEARRPIAQRNRECGSSCNAFADHSTARSYSPPQNM